MCEKFKTVIKKIQSNLFDNPIDKYEGWPLIVGHFSPEIAVLFKSEQDQYDILHHLGKLLPSEQIATIALSGSITGGEKKYGDVDMVVWSTKGGDSFSQEMTYSKYNLPIHTWYINTNSKEPLWVVSQNVVNKAIEKGYYIYQKK